MAQRELMRAAPGKSAGAVINAATNFYNDLCARDKALNKTGPDAINEFTSAAQMTAVYQQYKQQQDAERAALQAAERAAMHAGAGPSAADHSAGAWPLQSVC